MRLWIDCEFNSYKGQLMSLALVGEGVQFYAVLPLPDEIDPWVMKNVVPILGAKPAPIDEAQAELETFLSAFDSVHIVADWPEDIAHFCDFLITGPGQRIDTPPLTMEVVRIDAPSVVPHNALWDAIGIRDHMLALEASQPPDAGEGREGEK